MTGPTLFTLGEPTDTMWGAFTATGPWELQRDEIEWLPQVDELRAAAWREVPKLTKPRKLPPGGRVASVAVTVAAAVIPWLITSKTTGFGDRSTRISTISRRLRLAFARLGPAYIKLGQIVSSGEGLFPAELVDEFKLLRDKVPAERFDVVTEIIEAELGRPMLDVFEYVEPRPVAAASIAQVHRARLLTGEDVVIKVQRPGIAKLVRRDIAAMSWLSKYLIGRIPVAGLANPPALVELFAETIMEELDFRIEGANMLDVAATIATLQRDGYVIPRPHPTLVTKRLLVMQRLEGFSFDDVEGMRDVGIDTEQVIRNGMITFMEGAMLHGIFHGDLHGGNLFVLNDGTTALLDFGITARLSTKRRLAFLSMMMGAITNDVKTQVIALRDLGALPTDSDLDAVIVDLGLDRPAMDATKMTADEMVAEVQQVTKALLNYGARLPKELMLYIKNLVFLDGAIARLAPDLDLIGEVQKISIEFATKHGAAIGRDLGMDANPVDFDFERVKAGFGVDSDTERLTYRELQARRKLIHKRMRDR